MGDYQAACDVVALASAEKLEAVVNAASKHANVAVATDEDDGEKRGLSDTALTRETSKVHDELSEVSP